MDNAESPEQQSSPTTSGPDEGTQGGEGRNRRRRRRGRRGGGRTEDSQQEASGDGSAEPTSERAQVAPRPERAPSEARPERTQGEPRPEGSEESRRRRKKKKSSGAPQQNGAGAAPVAEDAPKPEADSRKKERAPRGSVLQRRVNRGDYVDAPREKEEPTPAPRPVNAVTVEAYVAHHKGWQREVLTTIRGIIKNAANDIEESILWSQPVFSLNGPVCYLKAFSDHVNFGFWRGTELTDSEGLLVGDLTMMRHVTLRSANDVNKDVFDAFVRQAVRLNREKGDPTLS